MGIRDKLRENRERREEAFLRPGGPGADEQMEKIAQEDPYDLRSESVPPVPPS